MKHIIPIALLLAGCQTAPSTVSPDQINLATERMALIATRCYVSLQEGISQKPCQDMLDQLPAYDIMIRQYSAAIKRGEVSVERIRQIDRVLLTGTAQVLAQIQEIAP